MHTCIEYLHISSMHSDGWWLSLLLYFFTTSSCSDCFPTCNRQLKPPTTKTSPSSSSSLYLEPRGRSLPDRLATWSLLPNIGTGKVRVWQQQQKSTPKKHQNLRHRIHGTNDIFSYVILCLHLPYGGGTQILHLWNVYLHLVDFYGKSLGFQAHLVDFYGVHVGKYTVRPMDPLGKASIVGKAHCWHHISP